MLSELNVRILLKTVIFCLLYWIQSKSIKAQDTNEGVQEFALFF